MIKFAIKFLDKNYHLKKIINFFKYKKISTIVDIGGHEGIYAENFYNKNVKKFYIFEPQKKYFNILKNKFKKISKIKIYNYAVGNKNESKLLKIGSLDTTSTLTKIQENSNWYKIKKIILFNKGFLDQYKVNIKRLDSINEIKNLKKISLIKIDTEGYELRVLKGAEKTLKKVNFIIIEIHQNKMYKNYNPKKIIKFLENKNFKIIKKFKFPIIPFYDYIFENLNLK